MLSTAPELAAIGREYLPILLFFGVAIAFALVFVGLRVQHRRRSSLVGGVGEDAAYVAEQVAKRATAALAA